jgi:hypothetical protein
MLDAIQQNNSITALAFCAESIDDDLFRRLAEVITSKNRITELNFNLTRIETIEQTQALGSIIKTNPLTNLIVSNTIEFSSADPELMQIFFDSLQQNNTLEFFSINSTDLHDNGWIMLSKWLQKSTAIRTLCLANNAIEDTGVEALMKAIEKNTSLKTLHMPFNLLSHMGCKFLAETLKKTETLETLNIYIQDTNKRDNLQIICDSLKKNVSLTELELTLLSPVIILEQLVNMQLIDMLDVNETLVKLNVNPGTFVGDGKISIRLNRNLTYRTQLNTRRIDLLILIHNIARSDDSFKQFPSEIWLLIFLHLKIRNWRIPQAANQIFNLYNR